MEIIVKSVESLRRLESPEEVDVNISYVIDTETTPENDDRVSYIKEDTGGEISAVVRTSTDGRRAGALNRGLKELDETDYVAIFDVDSRPEKDFLTACVKQLKDTDDAVLSTCPREILNAERNVFTRLVDAEYDFLTNMQLLLQSIGGFNHFNGLIGVLEADYLMKKGLNENRMCEDTDFTQKAYLDGKRPVVNSNSSVGEQAVTNFSDLYSQKVRWMNGAVEGIKYFSRPFLTGDISIKLKVSWMSAMFLPFFAVLLSPLAFLHALKNMVSERKIVRPVSRGLYLFVFAWFVTFCGLVNILRICTGGEIVWKDSERDII